MSQALGAHALGTEPLAGDPLHDAPTVTVTTIGTVTAGGPVMTVEWVYAQQQNDPQDAWRVEILNDALDTTYYDSGWLEGEDLSHDIDLDEEGVPHDSTDVTARVSVRNPLAFGGWEVSDVDAFIVEFGTPHCTITVPPASGTQATTDGIDVEWSFADDRPGKTQGAYRVRLLLAGTGLVVHDTGWVVSTDTSYSIPTVLNDGSQYTVEVQLKNDQGIRSD